MPDRYGDTDRDDPIPGLIDPELNAVALTVGCRHCHAPAGQPCTNPTLPKQPPTRIPHPCRMADAEEIPF